MPSNRSIGYRPLQYVGLLSTLVLACAGCQSMNRKDLPCDASWADEQMLLSGNDDHQGIEYASQESFTEQTPSARGPKKSEVSSRLAHSTNKAATQVATSRQASLPSPVNLAAPVIDSPQHEQTDTFPNDSVVTVADLSVDPQGQEPLIGGTRLGTAQMTATEHALRLQEENMKLKAIHTSLQAEIQRLKKDAESTEAFIDRMGLAVSNAQQELTRLEKRNEDLRKELVDLESEKKRQQLEHDRMLQSIRDELDDVLMREIASVEN